MECTTLSPNVKQCQRCGLSSPGAQRRAGDGRSFAQIAQKRNAEFPQCARRASDVDGNTSRRIEAIRDSALMLVGTPPNSKTAKNRRPNPNAASDAGRNTCPISSRHGNSAFAPTSAAGLLLLSCHRIGIHAGIAESNIGQRRKTVILAVPVNAGMRGFVTTRYLGQNQRKKLCLCRCVRSAANQYPTVTPSNAGQMNAQGRAICAWRRRLLREIDRRGRARNAGNRLRLSIETNAEDIVLAFALSDITEESAKQNGALSRGALTLKTLTRLLSAVTTSGRAISVDARHHAHYAAQPILSHQKSIILCHWPKVALTHGTM